MHAMLIEDATIKLLMTSVMNQSGKECDGVNAFFVDLLKQRDQHTVMAKAADCIFGWLERAGLTYASLPPCAGDNDICCTRNLFLYETYDFILRGMLITSFLKGVHGRIQLQEGRLFLRIPPSAVMLYAAAHAFKYDGILEKFKQEINGIYMKKHRVLAHLFGGLPMEDDEIDHDGHTEDCAHYPASRTTFI
jgi:hypothetical protein